MRQHLDTLKDIRDHLTNNINAMFILATSLEDSIASATGTTIRECKVRIITNHMAVEEARLNNLILEMEGTPDGNE